MDERRKFPRLDEAWPVRYRILEFSGKQVHRSRTINVSAGGVRFFTNASLKPGTLLELELLIPSDSLPVYSRGKVVWQGRVVWCKESGDKDLLPLEIGVEFVDIDDYDKKRLYSYISQRIEKKK
ncbi:MAG: hypothetical protein COV72_03515 [Candidatus Omnitrophica bacterium CG11_big_fil_rev_8_21_14_0_20_42_13]|uniref:PilZ domain-containing protein n=1 Tax=Candidatus Ghiorseimicrobium undicola TaxID=1974746 RepID=A0A2H0LY59_9BACT|nr:MAG: hypothetical protein COV72_03515 [Candidatus Omnitrophica bacterium CG11_big_fil_rev_8_21_14_0_20_42_13]